MAYNRTGLAPWSLSREAGVESATVDGTIEVPQYIQPTLNTGFVDEKGDWKGNKSSDKVFIAFGKDEAVANGAVVLAPQATGSKWPLDMTGFNSVIFAIKPTNGGNYAVAGVMGPDDFSYANLAPVNSAAPLKGAYRRSDMDNLLFDSADTMTADVWNIFPIINQLQGQKLLQFSITNNSGGSSDIETAFMRLV